MDGDDFDAWYRSEHARLVSVLTLVARNVAVAADVTDEAFARAYERWARVRKMAAPNGWVYRTALNELRRRHRRAALEARVLRRVHADVSAPPADWSPEVWDALSRLPRRERTAIALRYVADLSTDATADAMGVAPGTVGSTLHAARTRLAALLTDTPPVHEGQVTDA
jgi:RNA polymerase sigma-70 factor (ECF subfamily)